MTDNGPTDKAVFGDTGKEGLPGVIAPPVAGSGELAGLGRLPQPDTRNASYPMPKLAVPSEVRRRHWHGGSVLDQLDTPMCVGFSGWQWLASGPVVNHPLFTPQDLYKWAQENDQWPGEDYEGSSTLGLMKALKSKNLISDYVWATDAETLMAWVLNKGPVLVGTNWYNDMFTPDKDGFLEPAGDMVGGHEWCIIGGDRDRKCKFDGSTGAFRMLNSWGPKWGDHGRAWVSMKTMDRLIKEDGEAVTASEIKVR